MFIGTVLGAWLMPGPRMVGSVTFDYDTLLFAAMSVLVGFQSVNFATFTKMFAIHDGLLPDDPRLNRLYRYVTLETGLILGTLMILAGAAIWVFGLNYWRSHNFGSLDPDHSLRIVIPGLVFLTLGMEIVLSSFFLSVLRMGRR